jgi:ribosome maturation factor RimP
MVGLSGYLFSSLNYMQTKVQRVVSETVVGLGYTLVNIKYRSHGDLVVDIEWPYQPNNTERLITIDDCEYVTRQLQYVLTVEDINYQRLEVGSAGTDRPLNTVTDLSRFTGAMVEVILKKPIMVSDPARSGTYQRRKFRGLLKTADNGWQIECSDYLYKQDKNSKTKHSSKNHQIVHFCWEDIEKACLSPELKFKSKKQIEVPNRKNIKRIAREKTNFRSKK